MSTGREQGIPPSLRGLSVRMGCLDWSEALLPEEASKLAGELGDRTGLRVYPRSVQASGGAVFFLARADESKRVGVLRPEGSATLPLAGRSHLVHLNGRAAVLTLAEADAATAAALRSLLPYLVPRSIGIRQSAGCGDRLGLATAGHVRAIRHSSMAPVFAQQSIRENSRTGRSPQAVMDDALWGVFQEGWREGFGADADHLKTIADIDLCVAAGYTLFTIDPSEYVDDRANWDSADVLHDKVGALPWDALETDHRTTLDRFIGRPIDLGDRAVSITQEELLRAEAKYGRAVAHVVQMFRHLASLGRASTDSTILPVGERPFELEISVDETETVTSLAEHVYIAHELKRLGVTWVSLAPRYPGAFEKGVDYIGDLDRFERSFADHLAVARAFGPYKLSLHSGSDKFRVYPIAARVAGSLVHLKTAGTSYLEALRVVATRAPALFRDIFRLAVDHYATDRATYHVSADPARISDVTARPEGTLGSLLDDFHAREVLHVTFGSVLKDSTLRRSLLSTLRDHEETYYEMLENHFGRHFAPFHQTASAGG